MNKIRFVYAVVLVLIFLTACSAEAEDDFTGLVDGYTFKSIDEIIDQELEVVDFSGDGSARLPITTSVPVACTVVYGTTPQFGSLSLDQDMAGGAHSDHSPLLSGLEPETEYYFRVQGVDDSGVVYISEVMTFTTPIFEESVTSNLASSSMGAEITGFSSAFGEADLFDRWGAGSAFDDNPNTEWSTAGDGDNAWIEVKLAERAQIESVSFQSREMNDGSAITKSFRVLTGEGDVLGPFELPDTENAYTFETPLEAQTLRFELMDTTGGNTGVVDIAVYGQFLDE